MTTTALVTGADHDHVAAARPLVRSREAGHRIGRAGGAGHRRHL
ncbi:hypothetical protein ACRYCC_05955 [Actinomadura scrupuli]